MVALGYGVISPALPSFARSFGVSIKAVTFLVTVFRWPACVLRRSAGSWSSGWGTADLHRRDGDRRGLHRRVCVFPGLLAIAGFPRHQRNRIDNVLCFGAGTDDPYQPARRPRTGRGPFHHVVHGRRGGRPGRRRPGGRLGAHRAVHRVRRRVARCGGGAVFGLRNSALAARGRRRGRR